MPTVAEQAHIYSLIVETEKEAIKARERWEAGEDFRDIVRDLSSNEEAIESGGELGWFPRGVLDYQIEYEAFNLSTGNVSQPIPIMSDQGNMAGASPPTITAWGLIWVPERAEARELDENSLAIQKIGLLDSWLSEQMSLHTIKYYGLNNGFDTETYNWINWQLSK